MKKKIYAAKIQVQRFNNLPFRLNAGLEYCIHRGIASLLNREQHQFYAHSTADFFLAMQDGRDLGCSAAIAKRNDNNIHGTRTAQSYLFECEDNHDAAKALFTQLFAWAKAHDLDSITGPKGFDALDGYE